MQCSADAMGRLGASCGPPYLTLHSCLLSQTYVVNSWPTSVKASVSYEIWGPPKEF